VDTRQGNVTLTGQVASEAERQLAVRIARDTEGVREVTNELKVSRG
jgi:hyperosmotically inducible protein